jgi:hypothetical protein
VGLRAGLDTEVRGKILFLCEGTNFHHSAVQSVVTHYTLTELLRLPAHVGTVFAGHDPTAYSTGGVMGSMLAIGLKISGFKPGRGRWVFKGDKKTAAHLPMYEK